jgi:hypothetical protein
MKTIRRLAFVICMSMFGSQAQAATLGSTNAVLDYLQYAGEGDFSILAAPINTFTGIAPLDNAELSLSVSFGNADLGGTLDGSIEVAVSDSLYFSADIVGAKLIDNRFEFTLSQGEGPGVPEFGLSPSLSLIMLNAQAGSILDSLSTDGSFDVSLALASSPDASDVPLPASLILMLTGFGALVGGRKKKTLREGLK